MHTPASIQTTQSKHFPQTQTTAAIIKVLICKTKNIRMEAPGGLAHAPPVRGARAHRKHDFYYSNARKRHVNCAICRTPSKHCSDYFVYASGAKP